jgi:death-on-curing protein
MALAYITIADAIEIHRKTVAVSGGGTLEHLDMGRLESVLEHIKNDDYYPTFEEKLTHLFFSACKFHCFADGNKRIAISLSAQFLLLNGYLYVMDSFFRDMENISYHVAAGKIDKELLHEILCATLNCDSDNEELKLKILHAIEA